MATDFTYTAVKIHNQQVTFVASVADDLAESGVDHAIFFTRIQGKWTKKPLGNSIVAICFVSLPAPQAFMICATGEVVIASRAGYTTEFVDPSDEGPNHLRTVRCAFSVGANVFVAGMARRVYSRSADGVWRAIDDGVLVPRAHRAVSSGFLCIGGQSSENIIAAGYKGEIWHYDGASWENQQSPTNVALNAIACTADGTVYIAGLAGTLIRGRRGQWEAIPQHVTGDDFWAATIFKDVPYFATKSAIYRLSGDEIVPVDLMPLGTVTTGHLDSNEDVMWSVGAKDLMSTNDGQTWRAIEGP